MYEIHNIFFYAVNTYYSTLRYSWNTAKVGVKHQSINQSINHIIQFIFCNIASVDTEMCCSKGKCGCQYFILLT
jgi:hypothetical protein